MATVARHSLWRQIKRAFSVLVLLVFLAIIAIFVHAFWHDIYNHFWMTCGAVLILGGLMMGATPSYTRDHDRR